MFTLNCKGRILAIQRPIVMGILNATPDSFYSQSRVDTELEVLRLAERMVNDGATILDIGGQSTRPGSKKIEPNEEMDRVLPAIEAVHRNFPEAFISVDTYYASVAREAVQSGASIVNDVSGGSIDADMIDVVSTLRVPYVLMHMQGTPQTMQQDPKYDDVASEVLDYFISRVHTLKHKSIHDIIIDPGFGFGKTQQHNYELLARLEHFSLLGHPLLAGVSRKGMVYKAIASDAANALNGTTVLHTIALQKGAQILRAHDVKEAMEAIKLTSLVATHA